MPHISKPELLEAMQHCLRDLENVNLISPHDLDIIDERRITARKSLNWNTKILTVTGSRLDAHRRRKNPGMRLYRREKP
jgi:hypothetical protein